MQIKILGQVSNQKIERHKMWHQQRTGPVSRRRDPQESAAANVT